MANPKRLMFQLGFDLESAVEGVGKDWPGYHKKLQKMVDKTPLKLKLKLDAKGLDLKSLRDYNKLTKEAALAAKRAADVEAKAAMARKRASDMRVAEATEEARIAKAKAQAEMAQLRLNDAQQNGVRGAERLNSAYSKQSTYLSRLVQRMGVYFGLHQVVGMIRNIREITAEFELQRVSLGALIQDTHQANVLFGQIKAAAVESPYQIKELVNYTKQLAAYGVEQNKLFDTVMQYADVAAGLGADMSRINLAMGQIRAAGVLKGTELRQLTELGIPMVDLLSKKLTELRGEMVSTGEVFSMISDKAISFKMVEEIFNDLTGAGGRFYNMQQKQAETLAGQWSNLQDSFAIMFEEIGNTDTVRKVMEDTIAAVKSLAENWELVTGIIWRFTKAMLFAKGVSLFLPIQTTNTRMLRQATNELAAAQARYNAVQGKGMAGQSAKWAMNHAIWMQKAAQATTLFGRGMKRIAAFFAGGGWVSLLITGLTLLVSWLVSARKEANRLQNELDKIGSEGATKVEQSVRNFERLAKIATESVDGTKKQTDALNELKRTYGDIIPTQDLEIDKLRAMNNEYKSLTDAIREKIAMQTLEQKISTIESDYGDKINKEQKKFKDFLESTLGLSSEEINRVISNVSKQAIAGTINNANQAIQALKKAISEEVGMDVPVPKIQKWDEYYDFIKLTKEREDRIAEETKKMEDSTKSLGRYTKMWEDAGNAIKDSIADITVSKNTKLYEEKVEEAKVKEYVDFLKKVMSDALKKDFDMTKYVDGNIIDFTALFNVEGLSTQAKNAVRQVQDALAGMTGWQKHFAEFSRDMKIGGVDRKVFLYTDEEIANFGTLDSALDATAKKYKELKEQAETYGNALKGDINPDEKEQIENKKQLVDEQKRQAYEILKTYNALKLIEEKGKDTDDWVTIWKNRAAVMKDFQQGVEDLTKKMGYANALAAQQDIMLERGTSVGIDLTTKKGTADELKEWYKEQIAKLTGEIQKMGAKEGFAELSVKAILKKDTKNQLIQETQSLLQWLYNQLTDFETKTLEENLKKTIDELARNVARSKEAKDFYDKMLGMTGDRQLSADLTMSVYGGVGDDLKENIKAQLEDAFEGVNIKPAFDGDKIDWSQLNDLVESIPIESKREEARKLVKEGIKDNSKLIQSYVKLLMEYDDVQQKRVNIANKTAKDIATIEEGLRLEIEGINNNPDIQNKGGAITEATDRADKAIAAIRAREKYELSKLSGDYIRFFSAINSMSSDTANTIRTELRREVFEAFSKGAISAEELRKELKAIDTQFNKLNENSSFFAAYMNDGFDGFISKMRESGDELDALAAKMKGLGSVDDLSSDEQSFINKMLNIFGGKGQKSLSDLAKSFNGDMSKMGEAVAQVGGKMQAMFSNASRAIAIVNTIIKGVHQSIMASQQVIDQINSMRNEDNQIGGWFKYISDFSQYAFSGWEKLKSGDVAGATADVIGSIISIFQNIQADKIKKLNEDIEDQEDLLKELEYQYKKLEKAAESAFGTEYLDNYQERLENLYATQAAYEKQAQAERDKGKQADEDAIKDYENSARDTMDSIEEMQAEVSERMLGTDLGSAARDFADAWLEAYKSFGNTSDAIGQKFREMIDNMVAESVIAGVMKSALEPVFTMIDNMSKDDLYDPKFWQNLGSAVESATEDADVGAANAMKMLESMGLNIREMGSNLSGISKDIATASEESILGLSAGINTQNFYISQIHAAVLRMEMLMQNGNTGVNIQDLITIQNQHLAQLPNIAANTANTLAECRSILSQVTSIADNLGRVISPRGNTAGHQINATLS